MTPEAAPPINSLAEIVQSSLKVKMAVYDDAFDQQLATANDSVRRKLWDLHEPLQEFRGPVRIIYAFLNQLCIHMVFETS